MRVQKFLMDIRSTYVAAARSVDVFGPFPVAIEKKAGVYRMQLFLQSANRGFLQKSLDEFLALQEKQKKTSGLKWIIDVDPMEMG